MPQDPSDSAELIAWLGLAQAGVCLAGLPGDAPSGVPVDALAWQKRLRALGMVCPQPSLQHIERLQQWLSLPHSRLVTWGSEEYPKGLAALADAPPVLFAQGPERLGVRPQVAVVGSRRASAGGLEVATRLGAGLADMGFAVVSGLALGIDAAAHRGALAVAGSTFAVLGNGPDVVYPASHRLLQADIASKGLLISEFHPTVPPRSHHFPRRNRILSGLCTAVVVVEAAARSGSLITARLALEQGREVMAVPGSVLNPQSRGCHALIRDGACLVESAEDVWNALPEHLRGGARPHAELRAPASGPELAPKFQAIWEALGFDAVSVDALHARSGLTVSELSYILQALELDGRVVAGPDGTFQRKPERT